MNFIPAFVDSWDGITLRVFIEGYTDGADVGMEAEINFGFSDRPDYTGFHIERGDPVWVVFNNDDPNCPIVTGFRHFNTGKNKTARRFRHTNIELTAASEMKQNSATHKINAESLFEIVSGKVVIKAPVEIQGDVSLQGSLNSSGAIAAKGDVSSGAISLKAHYHTEQGDNQDTSVAKS